MLPESQAINLLRARVSTIEEIMAEYLQRVNARPVLNADAKYLSAEQEFATRLVDLRMETLASIKRIEATEIERRRQIKELEHQKMLFQRDLREQREKA